MGKIQRSISCVIRGKNLGKSPDALQYGQYCNDIVLQACNKLRQNRARYACNIDKLSPLSVVLSYYYTFLPLAGSTAVPWLSVTKRRCNANIHTYDSCLFSSHHEVTFVCCACEVRLAWRTFFLCCSRTSYLGYIHTYIIEKYVQKAPATMCHPQFKVRFSCHQLKVWSKLDTSSIDATRTQDRVTAMSAVAGWVGSRVRASDSEDGVRNSATRPHNL